MNTNNLHSTILPVVYKIVEDTERSLSMLLGSEVKITMSFNKDIVTITEAKSLSLQQLVCTEFGISWAKLIGRSREAYIVMARHAYCYLACQMLDKSLSQIGKELGGRDHTTVLYAKMRVTDLISVNDEIKDHINNIQARFYEDFNKA